MPSKDLRKQKIIVEAEIVDFIPNDKVSCQKVTRVGNSNYVVMPNQWGMFFPDGDPVTKILLKIRLPALIGLAQVEYNCMLVVDTDSFPLEKMVKK